MPRLDRNAQLVELSIVSALTTARPTADAISPRY
jgi:hypothetical protein